MKILYLGDVVGRSGRDAVIDQLPRLKRDLALDFIVVNGENAAGGFGITREICVALYEAGTDVILTGNHVWDKREAISYIEQDGRLLRPANFPAGTPGRGAAVYATTAGDKVLVVQVMGRVFMDPLDDPFAVLDKELARHSLGGTVQCIIVDIHGEATSEKTAFGHHCDGRVSMVAGTHTHIPTADTRIMTGGTAYQTDLGMCGDYDSVIGMDKAEPLRRFRRKVPGGRFEPAGGPAAVSGIFVETDNRTGKAVRAEPLRMGPGLIEAWPAKP